MGLEPPLTTNEAAFLIAIASDKIEWIYAVLGLIVILN